MAPDHNTNRFNSGETQTSRQPVGPSTVEDESGSGAGEDRVPDADGVIFIHSMSVHSPNLIAAVTPHFHINDDRFYLDVSVSIDSTENTHWTGYDKFLQESANVLTASVSYQIQNQKLGKDFADLCVQVTDELKWKPHLLPKSLQHHLVSKDQATVTQKALMTALESAMEQRDRRSYYRQELFRCCVKHQWTVLEVPSRIGVRLKLTVENVQVTTTIQHHEPTATPAAASSPTLHQKWANQGPSDHGEPAIQSKESVGTTNNGDPSGSSSQGAQDLLKQSRFESLPPLSLPPLSLPPLSLPPLSLAPVTRPSSPALHPISAAHQSHAGDNFDIPPSRVSEVPPQTPAPDTPNEHNDSRPLMSFMSLGNWHSTDRLGNPRI
ncbi:hypothetical protein M231_02367 [Tremella mesenterica]|uniref:Uncharacterized protein n=1 Tax=Tremella mesenterica TaxID=5217 RepID=A0A4Q1BR05_TREME|nr:hypothetical protein M231_02367 [Tremella mesenterica]